jgi:succinate dehydrogenase / fumarate reductase cytochrome b subunit
MKLIDGIFRSTLGRKFLMALSGVALVLFVIGHLIGNLQIFGPPELINHYGALLHSKPTLLWCVRLGLLAVVGLHVWSAIALSNANKAARPVPYENWSPTAASYASRTMLMSGLIIASFVIYHLLHYTVQTPAINFTGHDFTTFKDAEGHADVYRMVIVGFRQPLVSMFYIVAVGLLCLHLSHGVSAAFQSLGLKNKTWGPLLDRFAQGFAVVIFLGYASIPAAVLLGLGKELVK